MPVMPSWIDRIPDGAQARTVSDQAIDKAKRDAARVVVQSERLCAESLVSATAEATRLATLLKPGSASSVWSPFWPVFARALQDVMMTRTPAATAGVLAFATLVMSHGGYVPDFYDRQTRVGLELEVKWLEELAKATTTLRRNGESERLLGFAALAAGRSDLATSLSDDPSLATLAASLTKPADQAGRAFAAFVAAFPTAPHGYVELGFVARAFVAHVERRGPGGIGAAAAWLHRMVHEGPTAPAPTPAPATATATTAMKKKPSAAAATPPAEQEPPIDPAFAARASALFVGADNATANQKQKADAKAAALAVSTRVARTNAWTSITLEDVHPLHGGRSIRVDARGAVEVVDVSPGLLSARLFRSFLLLPALDELIVVLRSNPPRAIMTSRRMGVTDEGRPLIELAAAAGKYSVGKWSNDKHTEFDAIATFLSEIATVLVATSKPIARGRWDRVFIEAPA